MYILILMEGKLGLVRYVPVVACLLAFVFAAFVSYFVLGGIPHMVDEVVYLFQAKTFASGRLFVESPVPSFYDYHLVYINPFRQFAKFPPAWPALLAVGVLSGLPWLVNPLLNAVNVYLIYSIGKLLYGWRVGVVAAVLACLSPFMIFMAASYLGHTASLFFLLFMFYFGLRYHESGRLFFAGLSGFSWGLLTAVRIADGVGMGLMLFAVLYVFDAGLVKMRSPRRTAVVLAAACFLAVSAFHLAYNSALTGSLFVSPSSAFILQEYPDTPHCDDFGFGERGCGMGGGFISGYGGQTNYNFKTMILNQSSNLKYLNTELFGWPLTSFVFIIALLYFGRQRRVDTVLIILTVVWCLARGFWWPIGIEYGARYYHILIAFLVLLTSRGIYEMSSMLSEKCGRAEGARKVKSLSVAVVLLFLWSFSYTLPSMAAGYGGNYQSIVSKFNPAVYYQLKDMKLDNAVVVLPNEYWGSGFILNDPALRSNVLFISDKRFNQSKELITSKYPGRGCFIYERLGEYTDYRLTPCGT
jgi:hypothetical protein